MKFIPARDLSADPARVWKDLERERELILTENGKPVALLTPIAEATFERDLEVFRRARALNALRSLQAASAESGGDGLSMEEVGALVARARQDRRAAPR